MLDFLPHLFPLVTIVAELFRSTATSSQKLLARIKSIFSANLFFRLLPKTEWKICCWFPRANVRSWFDYCAFPMTTSACNIAFGIVFVLHIRGVVGGKMQIGDYFPSESTICTVKSLFCAAASSDWRCQMDEHGLFLSCWSTVGRRCLNSWCSSQGNQLCKQGRLLKQTFWKVKALCELHLLPAVGPQQ